MSELDEDESAIVALVREWVDREVKPTVRELEHANTYPDQLIDQLKQLGSFGLARCRRPRCSGRSRARASPR